MKKSLFVILLLPMFAWAQSPFDGTWKGEFMDPVSNMVPPPEPRVMLIQNGRFQCSGHHCKSKINIRANGTDRSIHGSDYWTQAVKVVDNKTIELITKMRGKVLKSEKITVSEDGMMSTNETISYYEAGKGTDSITETYRRIAESPSGSHAISGTWNLQTCSYSFTLTYRSSPDGLMMSSPSGESYDAKFDGKDYLMASYIVGTKVSLTKLNDRSIDETTKMGPTVRVNHMTVSADGKTLTIKAEYIPEGTTDTLTATKQ
jgi:hypothetical protein